MAATDSVRLASFAERMLDRGVNVLPRGWWFLSTEHSAADVEVTVDAAQEALSDLS